MATLTNHKFGSQGTAVDVWTDPGDLPNTAVTEAYNLYVDGTNFRSRPGINGLLTTPMANPIYGPFPYVASSGTEYVIFCSGPASSTTGGKIYQVASTGGTPTEILDATNGNISFNINAEAFRIALGGGYAYMVWGASIYRTNLATATASAISALNPPVVAPTASLSNITLDALSSTSGWTADTIATNWAYTDLAIQSTTLFISSAARPFLYSDVSSLVFSGGAQSVLTITSGTGFTAGTYQIVAVSTSGVAMVQAAIGTSGSTGGHGTLARGLSTIATYTDLVIVSPARFVSSALRPFQVVDVGQTLNITGGTGFTVSTPTVSCVFGGGGNNIAELSGSAGTLGSTAGTGTITQATTGLNLIPNAQTDVDNYGGPKVNTNDITNGVPLGVTWTSTATNATVEGATSGQPFTENSIINAAGYSTTALNWFALDDPISGFVTSTLQVPLLASPNAYRRVNQFYVRYNVLTTDTRSTQGIQVTLTAYADAAGSVLIATATDVFIPKYSGQQPGQAHDVVFTFPALAVPIVSITVAMGGAPSNVDAGAYPTGQGFPMCANVVVCPVATGTGLFGQATAVQAGNTFAEQTPGILIGHGEPTSAFWGKVAGQRLVKDYGGSGTSWAASSVITYNLAPAPGSANSILNLVAAGLAMSLIMRQAGSNTEYTAPLMFSADGTYMTVDLSAYIPLTIYSDFEYVELAFTSNIVGLGSPTTGLFVITSVTQAGNLPISQSSVAFAPITYIIEELDSFGDATYTDPLESSGGPVSNAVQPTPQFGVGVVVIPTAVNTATTAFGVFRGGGSFDDGLYRLVATVPVGSDYVAPFNYSDLVISAHPNETKVSSVARPFVAGDVGKILYILAGTGFNVGPLTVSSVTTGVATLSGSAGVGGSTLGIAILGGDPLLRDLQNPYVTWNHTTMTLTDNTPDSFLNLALTLQFGRDLPPTSCTAVCSHQNRIWVASGQVLSGSWSLTADLQNGIYFTLVDLSTDPYAAVKGITFPINYGDNDNIQSLLSTGDSLLVLKNRSAAVVDGYDPTNFACNTYLVATGLGNVAPRAAVIAGKASKAMFLGPDNVYVFDGNITEDIGTPIQPLLHPDGYDGGATISASVFAKSAMMYYDQRLFVFAPVAGGSANSTCYVFDFRKGAAGVPLGWTTWGLAMTSGASLTGASTGNSAYMGGFDGQLYTFAAGGDKATPAASPVGITCTAISRGMGQEQQSFSPTGESGMNFIEPNHCSRMYVKGKVPSGTVLTLFAYSDDNNSALTEFSTPYTVGTTSGRYTVQEFVRGVQGEQIFVGVTFTVLTQATVRMLGCEVEKVKVPR
jgi:hypothetical protein